MVGGDRGNNKIILVRVSRSCAALTNCLAIVKGFTTIMAEISFKREKGDDAVIL